MDPPYALTEVRGTLCSFSVNMLRENCPSMQQNLSSNYTSVILPGHISLTIVTRNYFSVLRLYII